jgi:hypothetical protein
MSRISIDGGIAGATFAATSTTTSASPFAAGVLAKTAGGQLIKGALVECDIYTGKGVRYAFGGTAAAHLAMHQLAPGSAMVIEGYANCVSFQFIDDVDGDHGILYITPYY